MARNIRMCNQLIYYRKINKHYLQYQLFPLQIHAPRMRTRLLSKSGQNLSRFSANQRRAFRDIHQACWVNIVIYVPLWGYPQPGYEAKLSWKIVFFVTLREFWKKIISKRLMAYHSRLMCKKSDLGIKPSLRTLGNKI